MFRRRLRIPRLRRRLRAERRALLRLQQAHRWLAEGRAREAAVLFEELSTEAAARGFPSAPQLSLQSGRAWVVAGEAERGTERLWQGLQGMAQMGQMGRLPGAAARAVAELRAQGLSPEADDLEARVRGLLPGYSPAQGIAAAAVPAARRLPPKCPYCGGSVIPDSVEWVDASSALCDYCGSVLQGEG
jgi:hypothetical protein